MIHEATIDDIPLLLEMGVKFHAASEMPFKFNQDAMASVFANMIENPDAAVLVNGHGTIGGVLAPAYCDPDYVQAVELFWWADKGGIALLTAFEKWAGDKQANEIRMTSLATNEKMARAERLLKLYEYKPTEISYGKAV